MRPETDPIDRFMQRVRKDSNGCWTWIGRVSTDTGLPLFDVGGRPLKAHRWFYQVTYGKLHRLQVLTSTCGNKLCVNPEHRVLQTADAHNKYAASRSPMTVAGAAHEPRIPAQLKEQVRAIYVPHVVGFKAVAEQLGISVATVRRCLK